MNEAFIAELSAWVVRAGWMALLKPITCLPIVIVPWRLGCPLGRANVFIDTLHPLHEGRVGMSRFLEAAYPSETVVVTLGFEI
jgi:hypothetical protein